MAAITTGKSVDVKKLVEYLVSSGGSDTLEFPTKLASVSYCNTLMGDAEAHSKLLITLHPPQVTIALRRSRKHSEP